MAYLVQDVINRVSQDIRKQLSATDTTLGQPTILIDYTNRIQLQILRFSRWEFLRSETLYFMTVFGQTDYWIGPTAQLPVGMVNTALNLTDVDYIQQDQVRDYSNNRLITFQGAQPLGYALNNRAGQSRLAPPRVFYQ